MKKIREVVAYGNSFEIFIKSLEEKTQNKVFKIIEIIETIEKIPKQYLKKIGEKDGIYEIRVQLGTNIWRVFCFFESNRLVILLNGFCKKSQKTPRQEIIKAKQLMKEYYENR